VVAVVVAVLDAVAVVNDTESLLSFFSVEEEGSEKLPKPPVEETGLESVAVATLNPNPLVGFESPDFESELLASVVLVEPNEPTRGEDVT
jgi:hypothetical protein